MTRIRLRPAYAAAELAELYRQPHDHRRWTDHHLRVGVTTELARWMAENLDVTSAADLSCGNGAVLDALDMVPLDRRYYGDLAPGRAITGPIERTIEEIPNVDLFVCSESLEHVDDPDAVLAQIRRRSRLLLLSTPVGAFQDTNPEHYWAWDRDEVDDMLVTAGFEVQVYLTADFTPAGLPYTFGIWGAQ